MENKEKPADFQLCGSNLFYNPKTTDLKKESVLLLPWERLFSNCGQSKKQIFRANMPSDI